jgi:hypothetical protein
MQAILEVALGLGFVFLLFSIVASAIVEWISALFERRAKTLRKALDATLGPDLTVALLDHPVIAGIRPGPSALRPPSYLPPEGVAVALCDIARQPPPANSREEGGARDRLRRLLLALQGGAPAADASAAMTIGPDLLQRLQRWFTEQMNRATGSYKRSTQVWTLIVAAALTLAFDLDAGRIAAGLHRNAAVRSALAGQATSEIAGKAFDDLELSLSRFDTLPVGWTRPVSDVVYGGRRAVLAALAGWMISVIALGLGAPFWFDTLNRIASLRQTGPRPPAASTPA